MKPSLSFGCLGTFFKVMVRLVRVAASTGIATKARSARLKIVSSLFIIALELIYEAKLGIDRINVKF